MKQISLKQGIALFLVLFIVPVIALMPFRAELMATFPDPTVWQALNNLLGTIFVFGLAIYGWNKRKQVQELERKLERYRHRETDVLADGGTTDE